MSAASEATVAAIVVPRREYDGLSMAIAPREAKLRLQELQAFIKEVMVEGEDFGTIPGTDKPSLWQAGAQKLAEIYGLSHTFLIVDQVRDWERGFFYFEYKCILTSRRDGSPVGEGIGSCNSRESKYAGRWVYEREVPAGIDKVKLKVKEGSGPRGPYKRYLVPNDDPYSLVNTIQKMGAKRAYIHAVIAATRTSAIFTQDVEDLPEEAFGEAADERPWTKPAAAAVELETQRASELQAAATMADLETAWKVVGEDLKSKALGLDAKIRLTSIKNARKVALGKTPSTPPPPDPPKQGAAADSGTRPAAKPAAPACSVCGKPVDGTGVETTDGDGVIGIRHPACKPARQPGQEG